MMRQITFLGAATIALVAAMPVSAQDNTVVKRVERLEKEMRAVQRSVFPGGSPTFFEGEIAPDNTPGERARTNAPASMLSFLSYKVTRIPFNAHQLAMSPPITPAPIT